MKFASMILAYNEENLIKGCLYGLKDLFNIVGISTPWCGEHKGFDKTEKYAREMGAYIFKQNFKKEHEQRSAISGLAKKLGYDYIFVIDADEFYLRSHITKMIGLIEKTKKDLYKTPTEIIFWKNENYELIPRLANARTGCVKAGTGFIGNRTPEGDDWHPSAKDIFMYHFSYSGTDEHIYSKITHFSHALEINQKWYEDVYLKWTPEMENLHPSPTAPHYFKKAVPIECPKEIKLRYKNKI